MIINEFRPMMNTKDHECGNHIVQWREQTGQTGLYHHREFISFSHWPTYWDVLIALHIFAVSNVGGSFSSA